MLLYIEQKVQFFRWLIFPGGFNFRYAGNLLMTFRVQARTGNRSWGTIFLSLERTQLSRTNGIIMNDPIVLGKKERTHRTRCILNQECAGAYEREPGCTGPPSCAPPNWEGDTQGGLVKYNIWRSVKKKLGFLKLTPQY